MDDTARTILNHLTDEYTEPIRDPLWGHIYLSPPLKKIVSGNIFQKLGRIKQLGPAFLVYPGATHTRLSHSLGVFHLAKRMIGTLLRSPDCPHLTLRGVKAFLSAALLHDLGHFPYAHSLKELPLRTHESLTGEAILSTNISGILQGEVGADPRTVAAIVDEDIDPRSDGEIVLFRNILSGVLDPDKLDYLNRDAYFSGVPYGVQDIDFIFSKLVPMANGLGLKESGIPAVENILFSKYLMYRNVYWHRTVRIATAMIKKGVFRGLGEGIIGRSDLYGIDDDEFFRRFTNHYFPGFRLIHMVSRRTLYKTVYEAGFITGDPFQESLRDLGVRSNAEREMARMLTSAGHPGVSEDSVIIDIPEPISFEIELPILREGESLPFPDSGSVFDRPVIEGFTRSLRKIRIFVAPEMGDIADAGSLLHGIG